jgi:hypothetical protein
MSKVKALISHLDEQAKVLFKPKYSIYFFVLSLIVLFFVYRYDKTLNLRPQSLHQWRQCDGLSITLNYYQENRSFFDPAVHSMEPDDGHSGSTISEFPIVYFFIGNLWKIFGHQEWLFRLFSLLIVFIGLFALFKLSSLVLMDDFYSIWLTLLIFSSPVLVYYANSFVPNTTAFGLLLIAWYFIVLGVYKQKNLFLYIALLFFLLSALIKVTMAMSLIALAAYIFLSLFIFRKSAFDIGFGIKQKLSMLFSIGLVLVVVLVYYNFARRFNLEHKSGIFSLQTWPLWSLSEDTIKQTIENVTSIWINQYFHISARIFILLSFIGILVWIRKTSAFLSFMTFSLFIAICAYTVLWFLVFMNHDYYIIDLLIFIVFLAMTMFELLLKKWPHVFKSVFVKILFTVVLLVNIAYAAKVNEIRYNNWMNHHHQTYFKALEDITPYLRSLGIERDDKVVSIPDASFNITLYLMDQKGWTSGGSNSNGIKMDRCIDLGAEFLIINNAEWKNRDDVKSYLDHPYGVYQNIEIFDLRPYAE